MVEKKKNGSNIWQFLPIKKWNLFLHPLVLNLHWLTLVNEIFINMSTSRGLKITCTLGFSLGTQVLCEKVQPILLYTEDM